MVMTRHVYNLRYVPGIREKTVYLCKYVAKEKQDVIDLIQTVLVSTSDCSYISSTLQLDEVIKMSATVRNDICKRPDFRDVKVCRFHHDAIR